MILFLLNLWRSLRWQTKACLLFLVAVILWQLWLRTFDTLDCFLSVRYNAFDRFEETHQSMWQECIRTNLAFPFGFF